MGDSLATLQSARLHYRTLTMDSHNAVFRQFSDDDMCKYFSDPPCTWDEAADIITHYATPNPTKRYARWGMFLDDGTFVGTCGFHFYERDKGQVEIGYDIWKDHWRNGYGKEAVHALTKYIWQTLDVHTIYALIHPENIASLGVARALGFRESPLLRETSDGPFVCMALKHVAK